MSLHGITLEIINHLYQRLSDFVSGCNRSMFIDSYTTLKESIRKKSDYQDRAMGFFKCLLNFLCDVVISDSVGNVDS